MVHFWQVDKVYGCQGNFVISDVDQTVTGVVGNHTSLSRNEDVLGFKPNCLGLERLPRGLEKFFPNLVAYWAEGCGITTIAKEDFAPFPNLRQVHFYGNKLESLSSDIFTSNPSLQFISFGFNPLHHIGSNTFSHLKDLRSMYLALSSCVNEHVTNDRKGVEKLVIRLKQMCPPTDQMRNLDVSVTFEQQINLKQLVDENRSKIAELEGIVIALQDRKIPCDCF